MTDRPASVAAHAERVVDDHRHLVLLANGFEGIEVRNIVRRIGHRLDVEALSVLIDQRINLLGLGRLYESCFDS